MRPRPYPLSALLIRPLCWPRWVRRAGLLVLPVSIPCWLFLLLLSPIADGLITLARGVAKIWNGEQRQLYRTDQYGYPGYGRARRSGHAPSPDQVPPESLDGLFVPAE